MFKYNLSECLSRLKPWIIKTPLIEAPALSKDVGKQVYLKAESFQKTGAFKFRGAMNYLLSLSEEEKSRGVITASSGNHGLGMSLGAMLLETPCTVVMPVNAPQMKQYKAKSYGAKVFLHGETYDDAALQAEKLAKEQGLNYIPSFNHQAIIEGQGTILAEILEAMPDVDAVFTPIGGGGLISGLLIAKEQLASKVEIIGVEPEGAASMQAAVNNNQVVSLEQAYTVADGVLVKKVGELNYGVVSQYTPKLMTISEEAIIPTQKKLLTEAKLLSETAGAVSVAGMLSAHLPEHVKKVVCVITGANLDIEDLLKSFAV